MRFQSKFRTHTIMYKGTRRIPTVAGSPIIEQGIVIEFKGPQRIFDSEELQRTNPQVDDKVREDVEKYVLKHRHYGSSIFLAPGQNLPEEYLDVARVKPKQLKRRCADISINADTGEVEQCPEEPTAGRNFCKKHDPDEVKITRGLSTTVD